MERRPLARSEQQALEEKKRTENELAAEKKRADEQLAAMQELLEKLKAKGINPDEL